MSERKSGVAPRLKIIYKRCNADDGGVGVQRGVETAECIVYTVFGVCHKRTRMNECPFIALDMRRLCGYQNGVISLVLFLLSTKGKKCFIDFLTLKASYTKERIHIKRNIKCAGFFFWNLGCLGSLFFFSVSISNR